MFNRRKEWQVTSIDEMQVHQASFSDLVSLLETMDAKRRCPQFAILARELQDMIFSYGLAASHTLHNPADPAVTRLNRSTRQHNLKVFMSVNTFGSEAWPWARMSNKRLEKETKDFPNPPQLPDYIHDDAMDRHLSLRSLLWTLRTPLRLLPFNPPSGVQQPRSENGCP